MRTNLGELLCSGRAQGAYLLFTLALSTILFHATPVHAQTNVSIIVDQTWTDTGIQVTEGEPLNIAASGEMNYWTDGCPDTYSCIVTPDGIPIPECLARGVTQQQLEGFPAEAAGANLTCWSLMGMIGSDGIPFRVGSYLETTASVSGELFLGVNDSGPGDNTGSWNALIKHEGCAINSSTVAPQPPNTSRTEIGLGEEVDLSLPAGDGSTSWQLTGTGTLGPDGQYATYMADGAPGTATITATTDECENKAYIQFTVVPPSAIRMTPLAGNNYFHIFDRPDIGFEANIYVMPDTVSFYNAWFTEVSAPFVATGVYARENGGDHCGKGGCQPFKGMFGVVPGFGTQLMATDCVYSGPGAPPPFDPGYIQVTIPWQYASSATGDFTTFQNVPQWAEFTLDMTLESAKAGAYVLKDVQSPTGSVCSHLINN